jgi:hypothetical protein
LRRFHNDWLASVRILARRIWEYRWAIRVLWRSGPGEFEITEGDGRLGWPEHAPFDAIHVGAAAQPEVVAPVMRQLTSQGILVIPIEEPRVGQSLYASDFVYVVPLTDAPHISADAPL